MGRKSLLREKQEGPEWVAKVPTSRGSFVEHNELGTMWVTAVTSQDYMYSRLGSVDPMGEQVTEQVYVERTENFRGRDGSEGLDHALSDRRPQRFP